MQRPDPPAGQTIREEIASNLEDTDDFYSLLTSFFFYNFICPVIYYAILSNSLHSMTYHKEDVDKKCSQTKKKYNHHLTNFQPNSSVGRAKMQQVSSK